MEQQVKIAKQILTKLGKSVAFDDDSDDDGDAAAGNYDVDDDIHDDGDGDMMLFLLVHDYTAGDFSTMAPDEDLPQNIATTAGRCMDTIN